MNERLSESIHSIMRQIAKVLDDEGINPPLTANGWKRIEGLLEIEVGAWQDQENWPRTKAELAAFNRKVMK